MIIELEMVLKRPSASADSGLTARGIWPGRGRKKEEWLWRYILKPDKKSQSILDRSPQPLPSASWKKSISSVTGD